MNLKSHLYIHMGISLIAQLVKEQPAVLETWVLSLGWEDPLENSMDCIIYRVTKGQT